MTELQEELRVFEQKHNCVQEEPPYCTAACPLRVDVRQMMSCLQKNRFDAAFEEYRKTVLFPDILSRVCEAPCRTACLRGEYGEAIAIHRVERALAAHAQPKNKQHYIRKKNKTVAVAGAGLTGLSCAVVLAQKGYDVTVYEKADLPGGSILGHPNLPQNTAQAEIARVVQAHEIALLCATPAPALSALKADAILLATGDAGDCLGLPPRPLGPVAPGFNPANVFVAGGLAGCTPPAAVRIAAGKGAATAIDRFLSGSALAVGAENSYATRLFTPTLQAENSSEIPPGQDGLYTREQAHAEANRCLLCECKACISHCRFLADGLQYPKKYIVEAQQSLRTLKLLQSKLKARRTNACNLCGLCKEYCPGNVDMGEVYLYSRRIMHKRGELPPAFHAFWLEDMAFSGSDEAFLCRPQPGHSQVNWLFFPGCQMGGANPDYVKNSYAYLTERLGGGVGLYLGCCGAPAEWAGYEEEAKAERARFQQNHKAMGRPKVILACPTCEKMFNQYLPEVEWVSLWAVFLQRGLPAQATKTKTASVAVFDPCASRYQPQEQANIRALLGQMGYEITELLHHGRYAQCCGHGGLIYASNPETARAVAQDRVQACPLPYVSYCVNCCDIFRREGKPTWHILELLFGRGASPDVLEPAATLSARRDNRRRLRRELLEDKWTGDAPMQDNKWLSVKLDISTAQRKKMEALLILEENLQQAIWEAERHRQKIYDGSQFITHMQVGYITYWVAYAPRENGVFRVNNAYCHRMQIEEEGQ